MVLQVMDTIAMKALSLTYGYLFSTGFSDDLIGSQVHMTASQVLETSYGQHQQLSNFDLTGPRKCELSLLLYVLICICARIHGEMANHI